MLEAFKQDPGLTNVTASDNKTLGIWVKNNHTWYKKGDIDDELLKALNEMGFNWVFSKDAELDEILKFLEDAKKKMDIVM